MAPRRPDSPTVLPHHAPDIAPGLYRHRKGGFYTVLGVSHDSTNSVRPGRWLVLYRSETTGVLLSREIEEFFERVDGEPRFVLVQLAAEETMGKREKFDLGKMKFRIEQQFAEGFDPDRIAREFVTEVQGRVGKLLSYGGSREASFDQAVQEERTRQAAEWPPREEGPGWWQALIAKKAGQLADAALSGNPETFTRRLVQIAALCRAAYGESKDLPAMDEVEW